MMKDWYVAILQGLKDRHPDLTAQGALLKLTRLADVGVGRYLNTSTFFL